MTHIPLASLFNTVFLVLENFVFLCTESTKATTPTAQTPEPESFKTYKSTKFIDLRNSNDEKDFVKSEAKDDSKCDNESILKALDDILGTYNT